MMVNIVKEQNNLFTDRWLFSKILAYVKPHKSLFLGVVMMLVLQVSLAMVGPLIFNFILEKVVQTLSGSVFDETIKVAIIGYISFSLVSWVFAAIQFMFVARLNARVISDIRIDAYQGVLENKISFFDTQKSGDLTSRIVNDTKELNESARDIAWVFTSLFRLILAIAIFFYFSPIIAIVSLLFLPIIFVIAIMFGKYERKVSKIWRKRFGEVNSKFHETMSKIQISKSFHREQENLLRFKELNELTFRASVKRGFAIFLFWPITDLMKHLLLLLILFVGTWQVETNGMSIATLVLFLVLLNYFYWPLITIASNYHRFQGAFASLERIAKISYDPTQKEVNIGDIDGSSITGSFRFNNVSFGYDTNELVLRNLNFEIQPGERIAIVGHTGAGKSTIASLLMRFYAITSGMIYLDEKDINSYDLDSYRRNINIVSQRVLLFKGTIRDNLKIAYPKAKDEEIWNILDKVQSREFIEQLPQGLDTMVEEGGKNLSGGQRQMISFARALLSNPRVIILDEATSAVDLYTESKIQDAIDVLLKNRTSISIAHRLTTIMKSDKIIVMENGKIVQMGDHDSLLSESGHYAEMYKLYLETQSAKYLEKIRRN